MFWLHIPRIRLCNACVLNDDFPHLPFKVSYKNTFVRMRVTMMVVKRVCPRRPPSPHPSRSMSTAKLHVVWCWEKYSHNLSYAVCGALYSGIWVVASTRTQSFTFFDAKFMVNIIFYVYGTGATTRRCVVVIAMKIIYIYGGCLCVEELSHINKYFALHQVRKRFTLTLCAYQ